MESSSASNAVTNTVESTQNNSETDLGCGCKNPGPSIKIAVTPTTGGQFDLAVNRNDTIENIKKIISKKLKVPKERICLLHRERQLRDGTVEENQVVDGSRLTLLPSVETGLLAQRPEQSVMQALESLNDAQVNDFLSGKAPLNLTMRLGDHMMLIQLQLSTVSPTVSSSSKRSSSLKSVQPAKTSKSQSSADSLPSLSSIVNSSETSCSPPSTKTPYKRDSFLAVLDSNKPDVTPYATEGSSKSANESATTSSFLPILKLKGNDNGLVMDVDGDLVKIETEETVTDGACKCDTSSAQRDNSSAPTKPLLDTRALAEASRNLTQTLKQLSSEVLTTKSDSVEDTIGCKRRQGAIIESMHHHGKGVYSGTFSGTLNPALQDRFGRPKRDISTIIHILNDLLCATPQYRSTRQGTIIVPDKPVATQSSSTQTQSDISSAQCSSVPDTDSVENQATRDKMERLRLIMEERRERRRAARNRPYTPVHNHTQWSAKSETQLPMESDMCTQPDVTPEPVIA